MRSASVGSQSHPRIRSLRGCNASGCCSRRSKSRVGLLALLLGWTWRLPAVRTGSSRGLCLSRGARAGSLARPAGSRLPAHDLPALRTPRALESRSASQRIDVHHCWAHTYLFANAVPWRERRSYSLSRVILIVARSMRERATDGDACGAGTPHRTAHAPRGRAERRAARACRCGAGGVLRCCPRLRCAGDPYGYG